jgi:hypothetical protein
MKTIPRTLSIRGKQIHLQELTDVSAVRADAGATPPSLWSKEVPLDLVMPSVHAFEEAGWIIVPREEAAHGAKVYLRPNGRLVLGTNRLTVRVAGNRSDEEARNLLTRRDFKIIDKLKFASNLYVVEAPSSHDSVDGAQLLAGSGDVDFAEPEFIEFIGHR